MSPEEIEREEIEYMLFERNCLEIAEEWLLGNLSEEEACDSLWKAGTEGGTMGCDGLFNWAEVVLRSV